MKRTRYVSISFCLLVAAVLFFNATSEESNKAKNLAGIPVQGSAIPKIDGDWVGDTGIGYRITQNGSTFTWWAAALHEKASGTINGQQLSASWDGDNGPSSATARVTSVDAGGRATRIEFSNRAVFTRAKVPTPVSASIHGDWKGDTGVGYQIAQCGSTFTWWAAGLHEKATGTINGQQLSASWQGDNGPSSATARITSVDANGCAIRIEFSNGAVFTRAQVPSPVPASIHGDWVASSGVGYQITQIGPTFTWWAAAIHEKATGTINGQQLSASWDGDNGPSSSTARITSVDAGGRATRIEFSNGAVFTRPL